ncbi:hypothetical protein CAPTEDRAFT_227756 [Capitella teleta]|uniref:TIR domain-containing protein n=1 Tax=Capitella teleta TaxID=283909 RepID=R7UNB0_CAPTE|nr:hypothetical protein CAPTEDRAFT_227756 [Capitella teleta]|eukprot:ELU04881.1 hypothetical protein CAPTEDRAFT_227756 [Capitella teleta]
MGSEQRSSDAGILGVSLARESRPQEDSLDVPLGIITLTLPLADIKLSDLRNLIVDEIPSVPTPFAFITREGWPINSSQELSLCVERVVSCGRTLRILRSYPNPKVGVIAAGKPAGFIFIDLSSPLSCLRDAITQQLSSLLQQSFQFVDANNWPVTAQQESQLNVYDVLHQSVVRIFPLGCSAAIDEGDSGTSSSDLPGLPPACKRLKASLPKQLMFQSHKDLDRSQSTTSNGKQLLLSYVRAEAAQHALLLKEELNLLGYSVFLDVHEIKLGTDWQDALNFAVRNCEVFIPLITPRYGETQWTNREVKLADVLSKFILPVNFLNQWPPNCLAIQLATTQFVPWNSNPASPLLSPSDLYAMDRDQARSVAQKLADRLFSESMQTIASVSPGSTSSLTKKSSMLRSCPLILPSDLSQLSQHREGIPMVLICLHPKQQHYGEKLQALLCDYEVCLSTNLFEQDSDSDNCLFSQESIVDIEQCDAFHGTLLAGTQSLVRFQTKADEAGVVIFIISEDFLKSKTCRQQVFYCEHRKCVIPVRAEDFCMPGWMSMLIGTGTFEDIRAAGFDAAFTSRIKRAFSCDENAHSAKMEADLSAKVHRLKTQLPKQIFVYIAGSTTFYGSRTKELCQNIGRDLARLNNIHIVTGGFYGVGLTVSKSFHAENEKKENGFVYHVLPERDDQDRTRCSQQNPDKTFQKVPFGKTVFAGDCVRERENIVSRAFDICMLIEGGPGAAHEAEQFAWNGNTVIPIMSTGGAASGKFNVPGQIFERPLGVKAEYWQMLSNEDASSDLVSRSVVSIVETVRDRLQMDSPSVEPAKMHSYFSQTFSSASQHDTGPFTSVRRPPRKRGSLSRDATLLF